MSDTTTGNLQGWRCNFCGALVPYGKSHAHTGINEAAPYGYPLTFPVTEGAAEERAEDERGRLLARIAELEVERDEWRAKFEAFYALMKRHHDGGGAALVKYAAKDDVLEDGFGNMWSARCPRCGKKTMQIVRPGKVQCSECD